MKQNFATADVTAKVRSFVVTRIPKLVKFSEYYRLPGWIAINDLRQKISQNATSFNERVFLALLDLAGTGIDALTSVQQTGKTRSSTISPISKSIVGHFKCTVSVSPVSVPLILTFLLCSFSLGRSLIFR